MTHPSPRVPGSAWLPVLALLQGVAIAVLGWLAWDQRTEPPPAAAAAKDPAATADAPSSPAAAALPNAAPAGAALAAGAEARHPVVDASASTSAVVHGRFVDDAGQPIASGIAWFYREGQDREPLATVQARKDGSEFAIGGVAPGRLRYQTRVEGYRVCEGTFEVPAGGGLIRQDLVLTATWLLQVKVLTPDGKPLAPALGELAKTRPGMHSVDVGAVVSAEQPVGDFPPTPYREIDFGLGRWRSASGIEARTRGGKQAPAGVAGTLEIDVKQPVWVSATLRHRVLTSVAVSPGQAEVTLTVDVQQVLRDLGTIRGRVVDAATGAPVTNARVEFSDLQSGSAGQPVDGEGRFRIENLRPGLLDVGIRAGEQSCERDLVLLAPGQDLDLGDVAVAPRRTIEGRGEGLRGKAEAGSVAWTRLDAVPHPALRHHTDSTRLGKDGTFRLSLLPGRYLLRASGAGSAIVEIDTRTLPEGPLVLSLQPEGALRFEVRSNGRNVEVAVTGGGRELFRRALRDGWKFPVSLPLGDYRVDILDPSAPARTQHVQLTAAGFDLRVP